MTQVSEVCSIAQSSNLKSALILVIVGGLRTGFSKSDIMKLWVKPEIENCSIKKWNFPLGGMYRVPPHLQWVDWMRVKLTKTHGLVSENKYMHVKMRSPNQGPSAEK